jgi:hypothetical protein
MLYAVTQANRAFISGKWSPGVWDDLVDALLSIEAAGGAYVDDTQPPLSPSVRAPQPHPGLATRENLPRHEPAGPHPARRRRPCR